MIDASLDAASIARVRFAVSPLFEISVWLGLAAANQTHPRWGAPGPTARSALADPEVAVAAALAFGSTRPRGVNRYMPDFMTPHPGQGTVDVVLNDQLEHVRSTPAEVVRAQLGVLRKRAGIDLPVLRRLADSESLPRIVAGGLRKFFDVAVADEWAAIEDAARADITARSDAAGSHGVGHAINNLHRRVAWRESTLQIDKPYDEAFRVHNRDLVLQPTVLAAPHIAHQLGAGCDANITYPAVTLSSRASVRAGSQDLLGSGRYAVLTALTTPASTTQLAARVGLAMSTVSYHLGVLFDAGLVAKQRRGASVVYERTAAAYTLLGADGAPLRSAVATTLGRAAQQRSAGRNA